MLGLACRSAITLAITHALCAPTWAQGVAPDAGSLLRDAPAAPPLLPPAVPRLDAETPPQPGAPQQRVRVRAFELRGVTLLKLEELQALLADLVGQELTLAQLQGAAQRVVERYRERGYLARVVLPAQDLTEGRVQLLVFEGRVGKVEIVPVDTPRLSTQLAAEYVGVRQAPGEPVRPDDLQRAVLLLNDLPGVQASAVLAPGERDGETRIGVRIADQPLWSGNVQLDNQGVRSTGTARALASINANNPLGGGDQLGVTLMGSEGNRFGRLQYARALGVDGWRGALNVSALHYEIGGELASLNASGSARTLGAALTYPLLRSPQRNLYLGLAADTKRFENLSLGVQTSDKRVDVLALSLSGDATDTLGGAGVTQLGVTLNAGRLDLSRNASDLAIDAAGPSRQGHFRKLAWNAARLQRLGVGLTLALQASGQLTHRNLDSSERLSLGGANGVRAYPSLEGTGDSGALLNAELRWALDDAWQAFAGLDAGHVKVNHDTWAGWNASNPALRNEYTLAGWALGAVWSRPGEWVVRAVAAHPIGSNPGRSANGQDSDGRRAGLRGWLTLARLF